MNQDYSYNLQLLEEKLRAIKSSFCGYHTPIAEYICDENGKPSDAKAEELARKFTDLLINDRDSSYYYGIRGITKRCLELYIYLYARSYGDTGKTFGNLLEKLDELNRFYGSLEDLILYESNWCPLEWYKEVQKEYIEYMVGDDYYGYGDATEEEVAKDLWEQELAKNHSAWGYWGILDKSFEILAGHRITQEISEEELQEIWDRRQEIENAITPGQKLAEKYADTDIDLQEWRENEEEMDRCYANLNPEKPDAKKDSSATEVEPESDPSTWKIGHHQKWLSQEEYAALRAKEEAEEERAREEWRQSFQDPGKFLDAYREFRTLFFSVGINSKELEKAVNDFLCQEGKSGLTDETRLAGLNALLARAYRYGRR